MKKKYLIRSTIYNIDINFIEKCSVKNVLKISDIKLLYRFDNLIQIIWRKISFN